MFLTEIVEVLEENLPGSRIKAIKLVKEVLQWDLKECIEFIDHLIKTSKDRPPYNVTVSLSEELHYGVYSRDKKRVVARFLRQLDAYAYATHLPV